MNTFVLIPGAWLGAWVWQPVAERLRALGHRVHVLTLSGLSGDSGLPDGSGPSAGSRQAGDLCPPGLSARSGSSGESGPPDLSARPGSSGGSGTSDRSSASSGSGASGGSGPSAGASLPGAEIGLATHVSDVLELLDSADVRGAVLVGHSYAGVVAGQVASLVSERIAHTVFVDSNLPVDGQSMTDGWSPRGQELVRAAVDANGGWWPVPEIEEFDGHDLTDEQVAWLVARASPHPGGTLFEPAHLARPLAELPATYIRCLRPDAKPRDDVLALHGAPTWSFVDLDTGHWPMVSQPTALTDLLLDAHHRPHGP
ncbi:alpha/beta fold hydrolase [Allorhizocola rhizosphaerae]|uniref:alpha/beta fold hydrolase n=1 Tax=Allorhizocola rhizosphaerae TaxID=1872709 RepID=UPI0013C2A22E|nr:alpha/beta hydrolase [Allorhizocola rhizosphaerae]